MHKLFQNQFKWKAYRKVFYNWKHLAIRKSQLKNLLHVYRDMTKNRLLNQMFSTWSNVFEKNLPDRVLKHISYVRLSLRNHLFHTWRNKLSSRKSMLRKNKYVLWHHMFRWQKFIKWTKTKKKKNFF